MANISLTGNAARGLQVFSDMTVNFALTLTAPTPAPFW
jgi:hypothetical protein